LCCGPIKASEIFSIQAGNKVYDGRSKEERLEIYLDPYHYSAQFGIQSFEEPLLEENGRNAFEKLKITIPIRVSMRCMRDVSMSLNFFLSYINTVGDFLTSYFFPPERRMGAGSSKRVR